MRGFLELAGEEPERVQRQLIKSDFVNGLREPQEFVSCGSLLDESSDRLRRMCGHRLRPAADPPPRADLLELSVFGEEPALPVDHLRDMIHVDVQFPRILAPLDPDAVLPAVPDSFRDCSCPQRQNCLLLFHNNLLYFFIDILYAY